MREKYGMKLNKTKCELLTNNNNARIVFPNNTPVKRMNEATYLGCEIGIRTTTRQEINKRFALTMATMKKLDLFWRHSDCPTHVKVYTADAVLRTKLLYGLESSQLLRSALKRLETFQLKTLRKTLKVDTTVIIRGNTNAKRIEAANDKLKETIHKNKQLVTFIATYNKLNEHEHSK